MVHLYYVGNINGNAPHCEINDRQILNVRRSLLDYLVHEQKFFIFSEEGGQNKKIKYGKKIGVGRVK